MSVSNFPTPILHFNQSFSSFAGRHIIDASTYFGVSDRVLSKVTELGADVDMFVTKGNLVCISWETGHNYFRAFVSGETFLEVHQICEVVVQDLCDVVGRDELLLRYNIQKESDIAIRGTHGVPHVFS